MEKECKKCGKTHQQGWWTINLCKECFADYRKEQRLRRSVKVVCDECGAESCVEPSRLQGRKGMCRSCHCGQMYRNRDNSGDRHPNWKGGRGGRAKSVRASVEYREWRLSILRRDDFTCQICSRRGGNLHVDHHPVPFAFIMKDFLATGSVSHKEFSPFWDVDNGRSLCVACHYEYGWNPYKDSAYLNNQDFRPKLLSRHTEQETINYNGK